MKKTVRGGGKLGRLLLTGVLATAFCWPAGAQIAWADDVAGAPANTFAGVDTTNQGTADNPYLISTEADLNAFAVSVNGKKVEDGKWVDTGTDAKTYEGEYVKLNNDIEMTAPATPIGLGAAPKTSPYMTTVDSISFKGTFDGSEHVISNLSYTSESNPAYPEKMTGSPSYTISQHTPNGFSALFGSISGATVTNVNVQLADEAKYDQNSSGLVAMVGSGANVIRHCSVNGDVTIVDNPSIKGTTNRRLAGLVAYYAPNDNTSSLDISNSYHVGKVSNTGTTSGGLVANVMKAGFKAESCYQFGDVSGAKSSSTLSWGALAGTAGTNVKPVFSKCVASQSSLFGTNLTKAIGESEEAKTCVSGVVGWSSDEVKAALGEEYFDFTNAGENKPPVFKSGTSAPTAYGLSFETDIKDGKTVMPADQKLEANARYTFGDNPSATGFEFKGWAVKDSTDDKVYSAGDEFTMPEGDVTFVAKWELKKPTIENSATEVEYGGDGITLTAKTSGYLNCTYQWLKDDEEITGATSYQLVLKNVADSGSYACRVTYEGYTAESDPIVVAISKATTSVTIETDKTAITGGGKVAFKVTANGLPEGELPVVTCDDTSIEATWNEDDGTWVATLPDATKTYKFAASYAGNDNYAAASAECSIAVTATPAPAPVHVHSVQVLPAKAATCTESGLTEGSKCSTCGEILKAQEVIPALGHTPEPIAGKRATCTESGLTEGSKCSVCGDVLVEQKTIPAFGHDWDEWVVTKPATLKKEGVETSICLRDCDATQTRAIPRLKSVEVTIDGVTYVCNGKSVAVKKVKRSKTKVTVLGTITIDGDSYNVTKLKSSVFKRTMVKEIVLKAAHLTKGGVKNCLKGSKVRTITVKAYKSRPKNSDLKTKYKKKHFTKANCGKSVTLRA